MAASPADVVQAITLKGAPDTAPIIVSLCMVQIFMCVALAAVLPSFMPGVPFVVAPLGVVAAARLGVRRVTSTTRAQHLFYWTWCATILIACACAAALQLWAAPAQRLLSGLSLHGMAAACFLWSVFAAYLRLFVIPLAPRLMMLIAIAASHAVFAIAGTPISEVGATPAARSAHSWPTACKCRPRLAAGSAHSHANGDERGDERCSGTAVCTRAGAAACDGAHSSDARS